MRKSIKGLTGIVGLGVPFMAAADSFNPDISLILDGRYTDLEKDHYELPGFQLGGEAGPGTEGFSLGHNELAISSNIDDRFYGKMTTVFADHGGETEVELEEAYVETLGLGAGATIRAGRFFSGVGYLNEQHPHAWDFTDAPLIYRGLFGNKLRDDGLQVRWVAPTDLFMQFGAEVGRGERFPAGGAANDGTGTRAAFAEFGGDIGRSRSHSWLLGLSRWEADVEDRAGGGHGHDHGGAEEAVFAFSGDSTVNAVDFVWKWAPLGNPTERNFKFQAEYFQRDEEGDISHVHDCVPHTSSYDGTQSGWYAQTVYQFMPRWRVGLRYDQLNVDNEGSNPTLLANAGLDDEDHTPTRSSIMVDYARSEYSRLRLQYNRDESSPEAEDQLYVQYIMSLGSHGAHKF